jgi:VanZ family protein
METIKHDSGYSSIYNFATSDEEAFTQTVSKDRAISIRYWLVLGWVLLIFYLSSQSSFGSFSSPFTYFDKLAHVGEYGVLSLLLYRAFINTTGSLCRRHPVMLSILFSVLYGLSDEIHQMFVPMRKAELADLLADSAGVGLFYLCLFVSSFKFKRKNSIAEG